MRSELEKLKEEYEVKCAQIVRALRELSKKIEFPVDANPNLYGHIVSVSRKIVLKERYSEEKVIEHVEDVLERYRWRICDGKLSILVQSDYYHTTVNGCISFDNFIAYLLNEGVYEESDPNYIGVIYERLLPISKATFYRIIEKAGHELPIFLKKAIEKAKEELVSVNETLEKLNVVLSQLE